MTRLTKWQALASGLPQGYSTLAAYLDQYDAGQIPHTEATTALAQAFSAMVKGADPVATLKLARGRGEKKPGAARTTQQRDALVCDYIGMALESDKKRGGPTRAYAAAACKFHRTERQIEEIWRKGKADWRMCRAQVVAARRQVRAAQALFSMRPAQQPNSTMLRIANEGIRLADEAARLERAMRKTEAGLLGITPLLDSATRLHGVIKSTRRTTKS